MRRILVLPLCALLAVAAISGVDRGVRAQEERPLLADHSCVGSWMVLADLGRDLPSAPNLITLAADGTATGARPSPRPQVPGGAEYDADLLVDSGLHGVWEATGDLTCSATVQYFTSSADGRFLATTTLSAAVEMDPAGDAFTADATVVDVDPAGQPLGSLATTTTATRIVVEPLVTDAPGVGTPSA